MIGARPLAVTRICVFVVGLCASVPAECAEPVYSILYTFRGYAQPGSLIQDEQGHLYGVTNLGGNTVCGYFGCGTVFQLEPNRGVYTVLRNFEANDGEYPTGGLIRDESGHLYGATALGGSSAQGTLFGLDAAGHTTFLHSLDPNQGGYRPFSGLVGDERHYSYGTTAWGGKGEQGCQCGVVFQISSAAEYTVLHNFLGSPNDGANPYAPLLRDQSGNLYGTTIAGGTSNNGTVFKVEPNGRETVLHSFSGTDGSQPSSGVIADGAGNLYGVTQYGGSSNGGVVYKLDPSGALTLLWNFSGKDGSEPFGEMFLDARTGNLFGTASSGGDPSENCNAGGCGLVFEVSPSGEEKIIHYFTDIRTGSGPSSGVIGRYEADGALELFGTTFQGAVIFRVYVPKDAQ